MGEETLTNDLVVLADLGGEAARQPAGETNEAQVHWLAVSELQENFLRGVQLATENVRRGVEMSFQLGKGELGHVIMSPKPRRPAWRGASVTIVAGRSQPGQGAGRRGMHLD